MKQYLIVGGNSGIGFETGKLLLAGGHAVHQWARDTGELSELGAQCVEWELDQDCPDISAMADGIDGLVYCPGSIKLKPFHRFTEKEFLEDLHINALAAAKVLQHTRMLLKKRGSASVVLFSTVAVRTGLPFHASVAMAKGAVEGLTRALAAEWAPKVRVNAIAPSLTDTPLASVLLNTEAKAESAAAKHPLKRVGNPVEIARLVEFLLGDDSGFITGQVLGADGGLGSLKV